MFTGATDVRLRPDGTRVLLNDVRWAEFYARPDSRVLTAPSGMVFDGASIPLFFSFLNGPSIQLSAALHDAAYRTHAWDNDDPMSRWRADLLIVESAKVSQRRARESAGAAKKALLTVTHFIQRWIIWLGVRTPFGAFAWRRSHRNMRRDEGTLAEIRAVFRALELAGRVAPTVLDGSGAPSAGDQPAVG